MIASLGGIQLSGSKCQFQVWAPLSERVDVLLVSPHQRTIPLKRDEKGYHRAEVEGVAPGARYFYNLDGRLERPDPASRYQPEGVHGPSEIIEAQFPWTDKSWKGLSLEDCVFYELHVGTFTPEGTFDAAASRLDDLRDLGITVVELMPVAQFPGSRNWGYDGVLLYAVQNSYGGAAGLKRFVDACHARSMAVALDVVYNHLGPEGNYLADYAPYFTDRYRTPWGAALNFDGPESDEVRRFFIENALMWVSDFHVDALRLDAIHAIVDTAASPFLAELGEAVHDVARNSGREILVIPETDRNDSRFVTPREKGGMGLDAQWSDDFHHALHTLLTKENSGYYSDFGNLEDMAAAYRDGYVYSGRYSRYRRRSHGNRSRQLAGRQHVVFAQNHDQVGNRMCGDRLSRLISAEGLRLATASVILSPCVPLLFMGEEYGEVAPFLYFTSHGDADLIEAVRKGRREEFAAFRWQGEVPDPQSESTFEQSRLQWALRSQEGHRQHLDFCRELLRLRKSVPALAQLSKDTLEAKTWDKTGILTVRRWADKSETLQVMNFSAASATLDVPMPERNWTCLLDADDPRWGGGGALGESEFSSQGIRKMSIGPWGFRLFLKVPGKGD